MSEEDFIMHIDDKGNASIHSEKEYVNIFESDLELIKGFIKENQKAFDTYMKKHKKL